MEASELHDKLKEKLNEGHELLEKLQNYAKIPGCGKLIRKIQKELQFLSKFQSETNKLKVEHLQCSNLLHLSAIVQALQDCQKPCSILTSFSNDQGKKVQVDIIAQDGFQWIKVIARSPQALERLSFGDQAFGQKSLIDQALDYCLAAENNPHHFKPPTLVFVFHAGVPENVALKLSSYGIQVQGETVAPSLTEYDSEDEENVEHSHDANYDIDYSVLNLDITAMIAYVSALTNGHTDYQFQEKILTQQAEWERQNPVKPVLDDLFKGKKLVTCQSAMDDFMSILETLGGQGEKLRAKQFLQNVQVVPDQISDKVELLKTGGKVRQRSKVIFGTGDALKAVTVSANSGFIRAAQSQNINLAVICHESRALTESKMPNAVKIH